MTAHQRADLCVSWRHAVAPCRKWTMRWPVRIVSENLRCPRVSLTRKGIRNFHLLPRRRRASGNAGYHTGISSTCSFWSKFSETLADCASSRCFNHLIQTQKPLYAFDKKYPYRYSRISLCDVKRMGDVLFVRSATFDHRLCVSANNLARKFTRASLPLVIFL